MSPDGEDALCDCPVKERINSNHKSPLGALIGRIGASGTAFFIGSGNTINVKESGEVYLACNDNMGPCDGTHRGSCYADNSGIIQICIKISSGETRIIDGPAIALVRKLTGHSESASEIVFSHNGNILATGSYDKSVRLWSAETGDLKHVLEGHGDAISSIAFSPDDNLVASGSGWAIGSAR